MVLEKLPYLDLGSVESTHEAAQLIFKENLLHLQRNLGLFLQEENGQALMQVRIATRRIRMAITTFEAYLRPVSRKLLQDEFKHFGRKMGLARDLDVLLHGILGPSCPLDGIDEEYMALRDQVELMRDREFERLRDKLQRRRLKRLLERFEEWLRAPFDPEKLPSCPALPDFAFDAISQSREVLLERGEKLDWNSVSDLHKMRKNVKQYRYNIRFFASRIAPETVEAAYNVIVPMQDCLGDINDIHVGAEILQKLLHDIPPKRMKPFLKMNTKLLDYYSDVTDKKMEEYSDLWSRFHAFELTRDKFS
ncbi:CHAD domain-containing protein [Sneathiella glossodoripedis]|uniref:CHAD domain-containing protein n=1 Tax=Sneathiella glossodoripedis TaxID=418853 RepID=UPI00055E3195|nr:CHAD domain-containing protein [Sneathiella glossodoripedis]